MPNLSGFRHYISDDGEIVKIVHRYDDDTTLEKTLEQSCEETGLTPEYVQAEIVGGYLAHLASVRGDQ